MSTPRSEIQTYIMDLLLELVFIHEEVLYAYAYYIATVFQYSLILPMFQVHATTVGELDTIMQSILEKLATSFWECLKQIDSYNHNGIFLYSPICLSFLSFYVTYLS